MKWAVAAGSAKIKKLQFGILAILILIIPAIAAADSIVSGYKSSQTIPPGWVVALTKNDNQTVELAPADDISRVFGVTVDPKKAPIAIEDTANNVYVATNGNYPVLVSTENGAVKPGDFIAMSSNDGISAKATKEQKYVIGIALQAFDGTSGVLSHTKAGFAIGLINSSISPGKNSNVKGTLTALEPIKSIADAIAGKNVSITRVYISLVIFLISIFIAAVLLWAGIHNGMISIGRNPLSRRKVMQGLVQVMAAAMIVFIVGLFGIYLLLRI